MSSPLYIYGLIAADEAVSACPGGLTGLAGAPVRLLSCGDLAALVGQAGGEPIARTRRNLLAHTSVLETAHRHATVLPLRFGTVAPAEAAVRAVVAANRALFAQALHGVAGRIELGLRASFNAGAMEAALFERDAELAAARDRLRARPVAETFYDRIELGRRVEAGLATLRAAETQRLTAECAVLAERLAELPLQEDAMIFNHAYLVPRAAEAAFDAAVDRLAARHGGRVGLRYVGPMPPFNFVSVQAAWQAAA
jgi:hypothetical protein